MTAIASAYWIGSRKFQVEAVRRDISWGHGIAVSIFDAAGVLWARTSFACHPEFLDFSRYQAMDTAQLLGAAVEQLVGGAHQAIEKSKRHSQGITVLFRLNGVSEGMACPIPANDCPADSGEAPCAPADDP